MPRFLLLLLLVVMGGTSLAVNIAQRQYCNPACPRIYLPVCGSDKKTYPNQCVMDYYQCYYGNVTKAYDGQCVSCPTVCPYIYAPVCGSNGITYPNLCTLEAASCTDPSITLQYQGKCPPPCPASCPGTYAPVCGSDGRTYGNKCVLDLVSCRDGSISLASYGECGSLFTGCPDVCGEEEDPVCGSDGVTYKNECVFRAATCKDTTTTTTSTAGECASQSDLECPVVCPAIYKPVCGTDGKTYTNQCLLESEVCYDPTLALAGTGECDNPNEVQSNTPTRSFQPQLPSVSTTTPPPATFTLLPTRFLCLNTCTATNYDPVCGSDGRTYYNACILDLVMCRQRKMIYVAHEGVCNYVIGDN